LTQVKAAVARVWQGSGTTTKTMDTLTETRITPDTRIGDIVAARPALARVFESLGLDYCCGGKQPLGTACARASLDVSMVVALLEAAIEKPADAKGGPDPAGMTLAELADHIEATHHAYVKAELPRLAEMAGRVAAKHSWRDPRLPEVYETVVGLAQEMFSHMHKEEQVLFPLVRQIEMGASKDFHCGSIANPIRQMEAEHESAGAATARLRVLTNDFTPDNEACNTHRALLSGLAGFEADLHQHVHKENNILFPRALELAGGA